MLIDHLHKMKKLYKNFFEIGLSVKARLSRIHTGDFFATRFEDFLCVKISLAEWLLKRGETRLSRSRLVRVAAV